MKMVTKATPASVLLLCGEKPLERNGTEVSMLNKFAQFKVDFNDIAEQIVTLRAALRSAFGAAIDPNLIAAHFKESHGQVLDDTCKFLTEAWDEPNRGHKRHGDDNFRSGKGKGKGKGKFNRSEKGGGYHKRDSTGSRYSVGTDNGYRRDSRGPYGNDFANNSYDNRRSGKGSWKGGGGGGGRRW